MADKRLAYTAEEIDDSLGKSLLTRQEITNLDQGEIPLKGPTGLGKSSVKQDTDGKVRISKKVIAEDGVDTTPGTLTLGDGLDIEASGPQFIGHSRVTGKRYQTPYQEIDQTGTHRVFETTAGSEHKIIPQPDYTTELTSPASATLTAAIDEIVNAIYIRTSGTISNFRYQTVSTATGEIIDSFPDKFSFERGEGINISGPGEELVDLYYSGKTTPSRFIQGQEVTTTMYWTNAGGTVLGNTSDVPYYALNVQDITLVDMPNDNDIANAFVNAEAVGGNIVFTKYDGSTLSIPVDQEYHAPSIKDFAMNIPTRIAIGTDINQLTNVYYNVANAHNISTINLGISEGSVTNIQIPNQDGHQSTSATISGVDTSTPKNVEFRITGDASDPGTTYQSNLYVVQVADPLNIKDIYYGASSESDASAIDLATFTKIPYVTSGQEESFTITALTGEYYYIFVPNNPGLDKIYNTTLGDIDVTTDFSTPPGGQYVANVQTIGGVSYDSYRRGPAPSDGAQDLKVVMK